MATVSLASVDAAALAGRVAVAEAGTRFELAPGDYPVDLLVSRDDVALVGEDPARTTLLLSRFVGVEQGTLTIEGLRLIGGRGSGGGAIEVVNGSRLVLDRCVLSGNQAARIGGAVHVERGSATFTRCVFSGNRAPAGAALSVHEQSSALVDRCLFLDNEARVGGALMVNASAQVLVKSSTFLRNRATLATEAKEGAEPEEGGAAVALLGTSHYGPEVRLVNCLFGDPRPLANYPARPGLLEVASCLLPPGSLERLHYSDEGDNFEAEAVWAAYEGLPLLASTSPGVLMADITEVEDGATDFFDRPLIFRCEADPGALAAERD